jgi:uncharacterized membrane protein (GlpM family)
MFLLGIAYTVGVFVLTSVPWDTALWLVAAGGVTAMLVALSMRFYHFWLSWLIWAVPAPAIIGIVIANPMSEGVMHPAFAILLGTGIPFVVTFGAFWLLRKQLRAWLA